ncbi:Uncharacterised protein [Neisseria meningitidis]|nr:Uncharacterised protein [Neisseria meningitidis]CWP27279.1 Uncharacterised protein [Neisseria meningitidis]CWP45177.1 Uncharacterised protein [Neisseria meningitidis]CWQ40865.1 Uncharacterised protein [Neisseria meningitidis]CWR30787.1 Uncharacterised protein [Neisseria meningitidis]
MQRFTVQFQLIVFQRNGSINLVAVQSQIFFPCHTLNRTVHHQAQGLVDVVKTCPAFRLIFGIDAENIACLTDRQVFQHFLGNTHSDVGFGFLQHQTQLVQIFLLHVFKHDFSTHIDFSRRLCETKSFNVQYGIVGEQSGSLAFDGGNQIIADLFLGHFFGGNLCKLTFQYG